MSLGGLFAAGLLASTLLPGGSEALLVAMLQQQAAAPHALWAAATLGNTCGGMITWAMGAGVGHYWPAGRLESRRARRWTGALQRWGAPLLVLSWLPVVGDPLCLAAGWLKIGWWRAALWIGTGKGLRYWAIIALLQAGGWS